MSTIPNWNNKDSDLNLLLSLEVLIEERNITRAARRMFVSQSTMSKVLDRLQNMFRDELLVRTPNGYEPTHRALEIHAELELLLPRISRLVQGSQFRPAEATASFRLAMTDFGAVAVLPKLMKTLSKAAPRIQLKISVFEKDAIHKLELNELDLVFTADEPPRPLREQHLFREEMVCLLRVDHPVGDRPLTLEWYLDQRHISFGDGRQCIVEQTLERLGCRRDVQLTVPYYVMAGTIIAQTDFVATVPRRLARILSDMSNIRIRSAPIEFQEFNYLQVWHPRYESDPAHKWLRTLIKRTSSSEDEVNQRIARRVPNSTSLVFAQVSDRTD